MKGKYPEHDSHNSSTQSSTYKGGGAGKPYTSGSNVHKGGSGSKSSGKQAPASQPKGQSY